MAKIGIVVLGCTNCYNQYHYLLKNLSAYNELYLLKDGSCIKDLDYVIVQSCGFTEEAIRNNLDTLLAINERMNNESKLLLAGCLNKVYNFKENFEKHFKNIYFFGNESWPVDVVNYVNNDQIKFDDKEMCDINFDVYGDAPNVVSGSLTIEKGCNNHCTFCKTNYMNHPITSIPYQAVLEYVNTLVHNGMKVIELVGDNLSKYGLDLENKQILHKLINELLKIEDLEFITLNGITIQDMYPDLLEMIKNNSKIRSSVIHLETFSDNLLKLMGRGHNLKDCLNILDTLKSNDKLFISTVLMTGFPYETEDDLHKTIDYLKEYKLYIQAISPYSDSYMIPSGKLEQLPYEIRKEHFEIMKQYKNENQRDILESYKKKLNKGFIIGKSNQYLLADLGIHNFGIVNDISLNIGDAFSISDSDVLIKNDYSSKPVYRLKNIKKNS